MWWLKLLLSSPGCCLRSLHPKTSMQGWPNAPHPKAVLTSRSFIAAWQLKITARWLVELCCPSAALAGIICPPAEAVGLPALPPGISWPCARRAQRAPLLVVLISNIFRGRTKLCLAGADGRVGEVAASLWGEARPSKRPRLQMLARAPSWRAASIESRGHLPLGARGTRPPQ